MRWVRLALGCGVALVAGVAAAATPSREAVPTGQLISPLAAPGAIFPPLNPDLHDLPAFTVDHAASMTLSPDGKTLLILSTGFNRNVGADGKNIPALSNEYVFVYGLAGDRLEKRQVLQIPNA